MQVNPLLMLPFAGMARRVIPSLARTAAGTVGDVAHALTSPFRRDSAQISPDARAYATMRGYGDLPPLFSHVDIRPGQAITLEHIGRETEAVSAAFHEKIGTFLREQGIDTSTPLELGTNGQGRLIVLNNHPQKAQIESLLAEKPELAMQFNHVSALASLMRAAQEAMAFQQSYALDPRSAVETYRDLLEGERSGSFAFRLEGGEYGLMFD